jgi:hypothetical protein
VSLERKTNIWKNKYCAQMREVPKSHNCRHILAFDHLLKNRELDASIPLLDIRGTNRKYLCNGGVMRCEHSWYYFCCNLLVYDNDYSGESALFVLREVLVYGLP